MSVNQRNVRISKRRFAHQKRPQGLFRRWQAQRGFTLIEILVSSVILSVVILISWTGLISIMNMSSAAQARSARQVELNTALDMMTNEIRMAESINQSGTLQADGASVSVADVVTHAGVTLSDLGSYDDLALYLKLPTASETSCPSGQAPVSYDNVIYDIRTSPNGWLKPKAIARYGRMPNASGMIDPCSSPVAGDIIADAISEGNNTPVCSGVLSGSGGFHTCVEGDTVQLLFKSAIDGLEKEPLKSSVTPRKISFEPTISSESLNLSATGTDDVTLSWGWIVNGTSLNMNDANAVGYDVDKIQIRIVDQVDYDSVHATENRSVSGQNSFNIQPSSLENVHDQYQTTCFTARGTNALGNVVSSNEVCTTTSNPGPGDD